MKNQTLIIHKLNTIIDLLDTLIWQVANQNLTDYQTILDNFDNSLKQIVKKEKQQ